MAVTLYKKKPDLVEAMQYNAGSAVEVVNWILNNGGTAMWLDKQDPVVAGDGTLIPGRDEMIRIFSALGVTNAYPTDYIMRTGISFAPYKKLDFESRYEPAA